MDAIPDDASMTTERLSLTPLAVGDADEMVGVLGDGRLHEFIGGSPATLDELRERYRRMVAGPEDPTELWRNWVVRTLDGGTAVGTVQATVTVGPGGRRTAEVAWVVGVPWQGRGYATEAAGALVDWLRGHGVAEVTAHVHPDHHASAAVARGAGLHPTAEHDDGEVLWTDAARG